MNEKSLSTLLRRFAQIILVAALYYLTARLGFLIALPPGNVTALWPPSGLALAAVLIWGWAMGIGIFAGSFLVNWGTMSGSAALPVAAVIAVGSTLQASIAAWLIRRLLKGLPPDTIRGTLLAIGITSLATLLAPAVGVTSLCMTGLAPWSNYARLASTWWLGDFIGILVFAPSLVVLAMRWRKQKMNEPLLWPLTCFIVGLALFAFLVIGNAEQQRVSNDMQRDAAEMTHVLQDRINDEIQALTAIRVFYNSSTDVTAEEFTSFTTPLLIHSSVASGFEWIPRVTQAERPAYEQAIREQGFAEFSIYEKDPHGNNLPAADRAEYFPVTLIEPFAPNQAAFGFDLGSNPARLKTIVRTRDSGEPAVTAPIQLVQETGNQASVLIMMSIYQNGMPTQTVAERRANLKGLALGVYHVNFLVRNALESLNRHDLELYFYDLENSDNPQFLAYYPSISGTQSLPATGAPAPAVLQTGTYQTETLKVGGRDWLVVARPGPAYASGPYELIAWATLLIGLLVAGAFLAYVNRRQRTEAILARSEVEFRALSDYALTGVARYEFSTGKLIYVNEAAAQIFGFDTPQEILTLNIRDYISDPKQIEELGGTLRATGQVRSHEMDIRTKQGEHRELLYSALLHKDIVNFTLVDLTDRIRAGQEFQQLSRVVSQMADTVVITNTEGVIEYVNPAFEQLTGYSRAEALGQTPRILKSGQHDQKFYENLWKTIMRGEVFQSEIINRKKNGEHYIEAKMISPIRNADGVVTHFVATGKDITERKQAEEALLRKEADYRLIAENVSDVIWILDPETQKFNYLSPSLEKLLGYNPQETPNLTLSMMLTPASLDYAMAELLARIAALNQHHEDTSMVYLLDQVKKDGSVVPTEVTTTLVANEAGKLQVVGISRDITERKQAEERILRLNRLYATLSQINQAIVRDQKAETLFDEICQIAVEHGQFRMAWIGLLDKSDGLVKPVKYYGEEQGYLTSVKIKHVEDDLGHGPTGTAIREGRCVTVQDIASDQRMAPWREPALQRGYHSAASVPFSRNGQVIGALTVYAAEAQAFGADEDELLEEIGRDISFALDFIDTEQQRQQAATLQETVYHIAEAAQTTEALHDLYPKIHHQIANVMPAENFYIALYDKAADLLKFVFAVDEIDPVKESIRPGNGLTAHVLKTGESLLYLPEQDTLGIEVLGAAPRVWLGVPLIARGETIGVMAVQHYTDASVYTEHEQHVLEYVSSQVATAIDRKRAEEDLRSSQASLEMAQTMARLGSWELEPASGKGLSCSKEMYHLFHRAPEQGVPELEEFMQMIHPEDRQPLLEAQQNAIESGALVGIEYRAFPRPHEMRYFRASLQAIRDERGQFQHMSGTVQDVTENRLMELAVQERVKELTCLFKVSRRLQDATISEEALCQQIVEDLIPAMQFPALTVPVLEMDGKRYTTDRYAETLSHCLSTTIGNEQRGCLSVYYTEDAPFILPEEQTLIDNLAFMLGIWFERRQSEAALRASEERFRQLAGNIQEVFWMDDETKDKVIYISPAYEIVWGRTCQSLYQNPSEYLESILPEDRPIAIAMAEKQAKGEPTESEYRIQRPDGSTRWIWDRSFPIFAETGQLVRTAGVSTDITERKQAEEQAVYRQKLLEKVIQAGKNITAITDLDRCFREIHRCVRQELGFDRVGLFLYDEANQLVHGAYGTSRTGQIEDNSWYEFPVDQWPNWQVALQSPTGLALETDYQATHNPSPENEMYGVKEHVTMAAWAGDNPVALITVDNLISQRQITSADQEALQLFAGYAGLAIENARMHTDLEQRVKERTAEVQDLYDNAPTGYHSLDVDGRFIMINQTELNWLGYTREEVIGRSFAEFITPDSLPTFQVNFPILKQSGWVSNQEIDLLRKDGTLLPILLNGVAIYDAEGHFVMSRATMFDITERKKAEEAVHRNEAIFRALFENSNDGIFLMSPDGEDLAANQRALDMLGYSIDEYSALPPNAITVPEQRADAEARFAVALRGDFVPLYERTFVGKHDKKLDVEINLSPVRGPAGEVIMVQSVVRDITERKKAQEALRESEEQNRLLFEGSPDAITLLDGSGKFIRANRAYEQLVKAPLDKLLGNTAEDLGLVTVEMRDKLGAALVQAMSKNETYASIEYTLSATDGNILNVESRIFQLKLGGIDCILVTTRDISERKKYEEALRESRDELSVANAALAKASRLKDEFLASMSHELRTPLTSILGLSEALQLQTFGALNEKQLKSLKTIEGSGRHLLDLINDILDLSKIEAGKLDLQFEPCAAADICQASLNLVKGMAHQKKQNINFSMNPVSITVRTDARRLKQMLVNLLSNAVKFTPEGGLLGLDVQASEEEKAVLFSVWDKGIGIQPEDLDKLFKPFVQLDSRLSREYSGTGLGLSLVQRMAELHGGSVKVESAPGEGSRFTILLPWSAEVTQPVPNLIQPEAGTIKAALVIEDNDLDAENVARYLKSLEIKNAAQPTIAGALEKAAFLHPSAILLDLNLPDGSGLDLLAKLKADERTRNIPVIITSVEERRSEALKLGALGYLVKPFTQQELQNELAKAAAFTQPASPVMVIGAQASTPLVMIADDNEQILEMVSDFLGAKGYCVVATRSGFELLERAPELHPNIMLVDIQMPGLDGLETMRRLRAHSNPVLASTPIIAVTALAMTGDREKCLQAGANEYMSKPIVLMKLLEQIKQFLKEKPQ